jgi:hypothetical protein
VENLDTLPVKVKISASSTYHWPRCPVYRNFQKTHSCLSWDIRSITGCLFQCLRLKTPDWSTRILAMNEVQCGEDIHFPFLALIQAPKAVIIYILRDFDVKLGHRLYHKRCSRFKHIVKDLLSGG